MGKNLEKDAEVHLKIILELNDVRNARIEKQNELLKKIDNKEELEIWKSEAKTLISEGNWWGYQQYRRSINWVKIDYINEYDKFEKTYNLMINEVSSLRYGKGKELKLLQARMNRKCA